MTIVADIQNEVFLTKSRHADLVFEREMPDVEAVMICMCCLAPIAHCDHYPSPRSTHGP